MIGKKLYLVVIMCIIQLRWITISIRRAEKLCFTILNIATFDVGGKVKAVSQTNSVVEPRT